MSRLSRVLIISLILLIVLTIASAFIKDVGIFSIIVGTVFLIAGYLGGGLTGEKYSTLIGTKKEDLMTSQYIKTAQKERYYSRPLSLSVVLILIGAVIFGAGVLGYVINTTLF